MTISVRRATADDLAGAAAVLAAAFDTYPWTRWSIPAEDHAARLEQLQRIYLDHALRCGLVLVDDDGQGVAAFMPPAAPEPPAADQERIGELLGDRVPALMAAQLPARPAGSWDLATIGVRPANWGRGVASALLREGLRRLDAVDAAVSLETSDPRNVELYMRHGFSMTATTQIPDGPTVHSLLRAAGGAEEGTGGGLPDQDSH